MAYEIWQSCVLIPGFSRGECASWVQAWGSIGAILATGFAAAWPYRRALADQERRRVEDAQQRSRTIARLFGEALPIAQRVVILEGSMPADSEDKAEMSGYVARFLDYKVEATAGLVRDLFAMNIYISALQRVDVAELGDADASTQLIAGLLGLRNVVAHMELMRDAPSVRASKAAFIFGGLPGSAELVDRARQFFEDRASALGSR